MKFIYVRDKKYNISKFKALHNQCFEGYLIELDLILFSHIGLWQIPDELLEYWKDTQESFNWQGKCLAV